MKERIIGAIVLVVFVVLVVPVFLDGPPENGEVLRERVTLPGQSEQEIQTFVLDRDREDPVPAAATPEPATPEPAKPEPARDEPAAERQMAEQQMAERVAADPPPAGKSEPQAREPEPTPAPRKVSSPPASTTGMWAVQLGSFGNRQNAEKLAADLRKQGFAAFLSKLTADGKQLHRVRIGPQKDRESAQAMAERLKKAGHAGQVVPHP